jgi:hypothetical protein
MKSSGIKSQDVFETVDIKLFKKTPVARVFFVTKVFGYFFPNSLLT